MGLADILPIMPFLSGLSRYVRRGEVLMPEALKRRDVDMHSYNWLAAVSNALLPWQV